MKVPSAIIPRSLTNWKLPLGAKNRLKIQAWQYGKDLAILTNYLLGGLSFRPYEAAIKLELKINGIFESGKSKEIVSKGVGLNVSGLLLLRRGQPLPADRPSVIHRFAIVDDEVGIVTSFSKLLKVMLANRGYKVVIVDIHDEINNEALQADVIIFTVDANDQRADQTPQLLNKLKVNFTFTDFNMPHLDGGPLIQEARANGHQGIIAGMSGRPDNLDSFIAAGADLALSKPIDYFELLPKLFQLDITP